MAKPIMLNETQINDIMEEIKKQLKRSKASNGKINLTTDLESIDLKEKATLIFSELAYNKMITLVTKADKEIGWHCTTKRVEGKTNEFYVKDVLVYPQQVTGSTVDTDDKEYMEWLTGLDFEIAKDVHMQGHSHVNMGVTPSGVDTTYYSKIIKELDKNNYYIFLIWNKKDESTVMIYDMENNINYEDSDIEIVIEGFDYSEWYNVESKKVIQKTYSTYKQATTSSVVYNPTIRDTDKDKDKSEDKSEDKKKEKKEEKEEVKKEKEYKYGTYWDYYDDERVGSVPWWLRDDYDCDSRYDIY